MVADAALASELKDATAFHTARTDFPVVRSRLRVFVIAPRSRNAGRYGIKIKSDTWAASRAALSEAGAVSITALVN